MHFYILNPSWRPSASKCGVSWGAYNGFPWPQAHLSQGSLEQPKILIASPTPLIWQNPERTVPCRFWANKALNFAPVEIPGWWPAPVLIECVCSSLSALRPLYPLSWTNFVVSVMGWKYTVMAWVCLNRTFFISLWVNSVQLLKPCLYAQLKTSSSDNPVPSDCALGLDNWFHSKFWSLSIGGECLWLQIIALTLQWDVLSLCLPQTPPSPRRYRLFLLSRLPLVSSLNSWF